MTKEHTITAEDRMVTLREKVHAFEKTFLLETEYYPQQVQQKISERNEIQVFNDKNDTELSHLPSFLLECFLNMESYLTITKRWLAKNLGHIPGVDAFDQVKDIVEQFHFLAPYVWQSQEELRETWWLYLREYALLWGVSYTDLLSIGIRRVHDTDTIILVHLNTKD